MQTDRFLFELISSFAIFLVSAFVLKAILKIDTIVRYLKGIYHLQRAIAEKQGVYKEVIEEIDKL